MAAGYSYCLTIAGCVVVLFVSAVGAVVLCAALMFLCNIEIKEWWQSPRMRLFRLGGATTLRRALNYPCTLCQESMEAGDKVRALSCGHVFHRGGTDKCECGIDRWLLTGEATSWKSCPICRQTPRPVVPWRRPPPSSPAHSPSASAPALPQLPQTTSATTDLEEALLPVHWFDEVLPEASSSQ